MSKFMILYRAEASVQEQLANATPEQQEAGMESTGVFSLTSVSD